MPQAEIQTMPSHRLPQRVFVPVELVADRGADEVGAVGVECLLNQEVHLTQIDKSEVDGDLLAIPDLGLQLSYVAHYRHPDTIPLDGIWPCGSNAQGQRLTENIQPEGEWSKRPRAPLQGGR